MLNSDPIIIVASIEFLKEVLHVPEDKIFIEIRFFKHISEKTAIRLDDSGELAAVSISQANVSVESL